MGVFDCQQLESSIRRAATHLANCFQRQGWVEQVTNLHDTRTGNDVINTTICLERQVKKTEYGLVARDIGVLEDGSW